MQAYVACCVSTCKIIPGRQIIIESVSDLRATPFENTLRPVKPVYTLMLV